MLVSGKALNLGLRHEHRRMISASLTLSGLILDVFQKGRSTCARPFLTRASHDETH